jgi:chorismate dehydratase
MVRGSAHSASVLETPGGRARRVLRLGAVPYLNVAPIIHGLPGNDRFELIRQVPSLVAESLHRREIDLGTIPSIEYAAGGYAIVPGIAIGSRGAVRSVRLLHRGPLGALRRVALDTSSRTSVALLKILLRERLGRDPEYVSLPPRIGEMLNAADAALVIGDPALYHEGPEQSLDLGEEWLALTGLPFVYAFWAGPPGVLTPGDVEALQESLRSGLASIADIASSYAGPSGRARENESYLRSSIVFDLGEAEQAGLREFYRRAHALGLIPRVPELSFHAHS